MRFPQGSRIAANRPLLDVLVTRFSGDRRVRIRVCAEGSLLPLSDLNAWVSPGDALAPAPSAEG